MRTEEVKNSNPENARSGFLKSLLFMFRITTILFIVFFTQSLFSQEIQVNEFKSLPLDISAREKVVKDPNGDVCSIIKVRIGLQDIQFSGDLGINKMEFHDGEYWLWVPPGTHKLTLETSLYPKMDFELPVYTEEYNVYIVFLSITTPEKKEYLPARLASFTTKPWHAQVFINDIYYGKTPIQVDIPFDTFKYSIRKKKFLFVEGTDSIKEEPLLYSHWLEIDPNAKRLFMLASTGYGFNQYGIFGGLSLGTMGRKGYYFTFMET
jgi:hypothetical protein